MKYIILFLSLILITSCFEVATKETKKGFIVSELSTKDLTAVSDGVVVYMIKPDSTIDSGAQAARLKMNKIYFIKDLKDENTKSNWNHDLFTCYKIERLNHSLWRTRSYTRYYNYVSTEQFTLIIEDIIPFEKGEKIYVFWKGNITVPNPKIQ